MKKVKLFFASLALVLITAGVFAFKSTKFFTLAPTIYYSSSSTSLVGGTAWTGGTNSVFQEATPGGSATQPTFVSSGGTTYGIYYKDGNGNLHPVFSNF